MSGQLYKKSKNDSSKPWTIRDFTFDKSKRILSYSWKGVIKGAVLLDSTRLVEIIEPSSVGGQKFGLGIFCYKVLQDGEIVPGLRRYMIINLNFFHH